MIKCFNSIKNCYDPAMTTNTPPTSGVQLIEVAPELPANASTISSSPLKGVPKTWFTAFCARAKCG
jgi:23S rRNA pseudouridine955/2504/2580 synthase